jgi:hypothetical protein
MKFSDYNCRAKDEIDLRRLVINLEKIFNADQKCFNKILDIFINLSMKPFNQQDILNVINKHFTQSFILKFEDKLGIQKETMKRF